MDNVQLKNALDTLERKAAAKIEENYNKFIKNVKETINALIQSSASHISDIENVLKIEIAEVKNMCIIDNVEAVNKEMNGSKTKYLKLKPLHLLKENEQQRLYERNSLLSKHDDQLMSLADGNADDNSVTTILESHESQNARIGKATTEPQNDQSIRNLRRFRRIAYINVSGNKGNRKYKCNLCDRKWDRKKWIIYKHIVDKHNTNSIFFKYKCTQCSYTAETPRLLTNHEEREHYDSEIHQCQYCHGTSTSNLMISCECQRLINSMA